MIETWKPIPNFVGHYEVSDQGRVRSVDRKVWSARGFWMEVKGQLIKPSTLPTGHLHLALKRDAKRSNKQVHRLVLEAFVGPCPPGTEACHGDGDPTNNTLSNLRWDTRSANQRDAVQHGTHSNTRKTECAKGHPYSPENTRVQRQGRSRICKKCSRENTRNSSARRASERPA